MWQKLIHALNDLSDAYAALLEISGRKRVALVAVNLKGLEPIVAEEEQQLERIRAAEKRRQDALLALSRGIPFTHSATTMADVEAACPGELRATLRAVHTQLGKRVEKAKEAGEMNEFLIRQALGAVEYHLNRISNSSIDPTYGEKGAETVSREKKFDFKA
ncbi:MAG: flagellar protein FlgN [Schwartzia sp.]|nr:flagellar protein FlgN [Schwartzia sp. (in: firmicutes)]